ncbi:GLPGLI family protein [Flavobacterium cyclinae]|uniref:GLPGLI family protein n=1 Tax=Flavobacterium cyclinae TaxID=2895947 RepID=UPI001E28C003|nr:GLPGLI family protein [Flavobacterium cyclinae]UGS21060.1 GLPGLI family protein [Flavobacterium cyclinae]
MKNIIFFLIFNFVNNSFNSGEVIYKIVLPEAKEIDESKYPKHIIDQVKKINEERSRFEFILTFNKNISKYKKKESLNQSENNEYKIALNTFGSEEIYYNSSEKIFIKKTNSSELVKSYNNSHWITHSENKKIQNFLVYKATKEVKYNSRGKEKKKTIIAWYCPEIPFNFGPLDNAGLPGLILEINDGEMSYVANKIKLNKTKTNIVIPKGKTISEEEYLTKIRKRFGGY